MKEPGASAPWHLVRVALAGAARLVPYSRRYHAAARGARLLAPLLRRSPEYRRLSRMTPVSSAGEHALHRVLDALTRGGAPFRPTIHLHGLDLLAGAKAEGRGVMVVSPHAPLCVHVLPLLVQLGFEITPVAAAVFAWVSGSAAGTVPALARGPGMMVRARTLLRRGEVVWAMIDRVDPRERRLVEFATPAGRLLVSDALIRVAVRCGAEVVFLSAHADRADGIHAEFGRPAAAAAGSVERITADFAEFVRAHIGRTERDPRRAAAPSPRRSREAREGAGAA